MPEIEGSDHCPVWGFFPVDVDTDTQVALPEICTHFWSQCLKRQLKLSDFVGTSVVTKQDENQHIATAEKRFNRPIVDRMQPRKKKKLTQLTLGMCFAYNVCHNDASNIVCCRCHRLPLSFQLTRLYSPISELSNLHIP